MVYSMTGFGRGEAADSSYRITVEVKTVNNRYLDLSVRLPRSLNAFEGKVRELSKDFLKRGKVDFFISCESLEHADTGLDYNSKIAGEYIRCFHEMAKEYGLKDEISVATIARMPEVFKTQQVAADESVLQSLLAEAVTKACQALNEARAREGDFLREDLKNKLDVISAHVDFIEQKSPLLVKAYEEKLRERIKSLMEDKQIDESRLLTEVAIFADKSAIDEELVRLSSHLEAFRLAITGESAYKEGVGRKLDFIVQEMNRESNTILSKSSDMEVSARAVELKTEIEKIREQIQNLE